jgi:hypothetical protein
MEEYITEEEFFELCQKGITYEGYIIGVGYAFLNVTFGLEYLNPAIRKVSISHYEYLYSQYPVQKSIVCQYIDTSEEQVVKSLEGKKKSVSEGLVASKNESSIRNNNVQSSTKNKKIRKPKTVAEKIAYGVGVMSLAQTSYEKFLYDSEHYVQTNGKISVWYRTNAKGKPVLKNGEMIPRSKEAAKKLARNKALTKFGRGLTWAGMGLTVYGIYENVEEEGLKGIEVRQVSDLFFGSLALWGGPIGVGVSAFYFIGTTVYDICDYYQTMDE